MIGVIKSRIFDINQLEIKFKFRLMCEVVV